MQVFEYLFGSEARLWSYGIEYSLEPMGPCVYNPCEIQQHFALARTFIRTCVPLHLQSTLRISPS